MNTSQTIVGLGGAGLIAANFFTGTQKAPVAAALNGTTGASFVSAAHKTVVELGGEMLFVLVMTIVAGAGPYAGRAMIGLLFILWLLFLLSGPGKAWIAGKAKTSTTTGKATAIPTNREL